MKIVQVVHSCILLEIFRDDQINLHHIHFQERVHSGLGAIMHYCIL